LSFVKGFGEYSAVIAYVENKELKNLSNWDNQICRLSDKTVADFKALYLRKEGILLSTIDAEKNLLELMTYVKSIFKPIKL